MGRLSQATDDRAWGVAQRLAAAPRLAGWLWALIRADALAPREIDPLLAPWPRSLARLLRLFASRRSRQGRPGQRLAAVLETQGPVAIKLGQFLSTRADIFGVAFADDVGRLKDQLAPFPNDQAATQVEAALGRPLGAVFTEVLPPVAAASLAQVHPARLPDGRRVAVKLLRPGVERRVREDAGVLRLAAALAERWAPRAARLEPRAFAETIVRALQLELDLRFEAAGADELRQVMDHDGYMSAPKVIWDGVARRMLTLEWVDGAPLSDFAGLPAGLDRPRLANDLIRGFLAQALDHGVFHADLHEGNLFIAPGGAVTAVDFGIMGRLGETERRYLANILWGFIQRDYAKVAESHFSAGYVPAHHDPAAFAQALRAVGEPIFGRQAQEVSMGRLLTQLFDITALFDMRLRPELVLLQKTMVTVEGVGRRIDPHLDIWAAAEPVVRRWISRELSPARRLRTLGQAGASVLVRLAEAAVEPDAQAGGRLDEEPARPGWRGQAIDGRWRGVTLDPWSLIAGAAIAAAAFAAAYWAP